MKAFKELRKDPHRPSVMNPADYVFVGAADDHPGDSYMEIRHDVLARHGVETGSSDRYSAVNVPFYDATEDGRPNYRCHHCGKYGKNIRYFVFFLHKPTKVVIVVGKDCAKKLSMGSREELDFQKRADQFRRMRERHQWVEHHEDEYNFLQDYDEYHRNQGGKFIEFLDSLWSWLQQRGSLSESQLNALRKWMARDQAWTKSTRSDVAPLDRGAAEVKLTDAPPTEKQIEFIHELCDMLKERYPDMTGVTRLEAGEMINALRGRLAKENYRQERASENDSPASSRQISYINDLMDSRKMPLENRRKARQQLDAGLSKKQASAWITKLETLPPMEGDT